VKVPRAWLDRVSERCTVESFVALLAGLARVSGGRLELVGERDRLTVGQHVDRNREHRRGVSRNGVPEVCRV
jgi:hypothetical protein